MPRAPRNADTLSLLNRRLLTRYRRLPFAPSVRHLRLASSPPKTPTALWAMGPINTTAMLSMGAVVTVGVAAALYHTSMRQTIHPGVASTLAEKERQRRLSASSTDGTGKPFQSPANRESHKVEKEKPDPNKEDDSQWNSFTERLANFKDSIAAAVPPMPSVSLPSIEAPSLPKWSIGLPEWITTLQKELDMEPGSLSREIYNEMRDPRVNPEVQWDAKVRIGADLCEDEKKFLRKRREYTRRALAEFLNIPLSEVHEDDVPVIATTSSGGGLRAM